MIFIRWKTASQAFGRPWQATSQLPRSRQIRQSLVSGRFQESLLISKGMRGRPLSQRATPNPTTQSLPGEGCLLLQSLCKSVYLLQRCLADPWSKYYCPT